MIARTKAEIFERLLKNRAEIETCGAKQLGLFVSFARNEQKDSSDVDFLVEFQKGKKNYDNFMALATLLEDILGRKVDLLTKQGLSPHLGPHILKETEYVLEN